MIEKEKTKILLVGDAYSIFLLQLISHLKKDNPSMQIDVLTFAKYEDRVITLADTVIAYEGQDNNNKIGKTWYRIKKYIYLSVQLRKLKKYDVVNLHYVSPIALKFWKQLKRKSKRTVLSFWGSDFYRSTDTQKQQLKIMLDQCDKITFASSHMMKDVLEYYHNYKEKMTISSFGLDTLDSIDRLEEKDLKTFRIKFSIPKDKVIVMCGYSSSPAQRHKDIINKLMNIDDSILSKCFFIFPMTYGNELYRKEIETLLNSMNFNSLVLDEFLTPNDNACLRKISDIMFNLQMSDQFSGSMQESLYSENIVLTGSWLPYDELLDKGIYMHSIDSFDQFDEEFIMIIKNLNNLKSKTSKNREIIRSFSHWDNTINTWKDLYLYK